MRVMEGDRVCGCEGNGVQVVLGNSIDTCDSIDGQ